MARNDVTVQQLRYFAMAAELGSMTRAAQELRVAQSAVSFAVAQLESQLGAQLFIRMRSKGLALTAEGARFVTDAKQLIDQLDDAVESTRGAARQLTGVVRIACFLTLTPFIVPQVLNKIGKKYPGIDVQVSEVDTENARDALHSGRADLAITYDFGFGPGIERRALARAEPYLALPAAHRLASRESASLTELAAEDFVLLDVPFSREYFLNLLAASGLQPRIRYRSRSYETVRALVARGLGFSILNQKPVSNETYDGGHVATVTLTGDHEPLPIVLARPRSERHTARARAVADLLSSSPWTTDAGEGEPR
ncbi:LysR substrate-binding domain-containing protein [Cryobacterium tepidiphilum]|uniref:LysR family transcriptional regulator n=1 Tax=Cryobacterium tepidiphilum TaxID=2486026 RepID=A0A3M8L9U5_9MICO|nr:LysR substrate-binding domain-containing protein [Cryobacterium tepidiphilum]RNE62220.1 LysR family transcriptional regulator [Cryobacterium tepidiphilum]